MDFSKIFSILNDKNIDKQQVFALVDAVKTMDLSDEDNIRRLVKQAAKVANKNIDAELEEKIVQKIKKEGISSSILDLL
ncbi:MAG: stage VI sporulation protein F [Erysipelotrichales bacterium]|nr:stage VI sporulation protein F [Erysipelotrichales bacterium]